MWAVLAIVELCGIRRWAMPSWFLSSKKFASQLSAFLVTLTVSPLFLLLLLPRRFGLWYKQRHCRLLLYLHTKPVSFHFFALAMTCPFEQADFFQIGGQEAYLRFGLSLHLSKLPQSSSVDSRFLFVEVLHRAENTLLGALGPHYKWVWWPGHEMKSLHMVVGQDKCCLPELSKPSVPSTSLHCDYGWCTLAVPYTPHSTATMMHSSWLKPPGSAEGPLGYWNAVDLYDMLDLLHGDAATWIGSFWIWKEEDGQFYFYEEYGWVQRTKSGVSLFIFHLDAITLFCLVCFVLGWCLVLVVFVCFLVFCTAFVWGQ